MIFSYFDDLIMETIFKHTSNHKLQFVIPLVCKRFKRVLDLSYKSNVILRKCEKCKELESNLKRVILLESDTYGYVCGYCRDWCVRCKSWNQAGNSSNEGYCDYCYNHCCVWTSFSCPLCSVACCYECAGESNSGGICCKDCDKKFKKE